MSKLVITCIRGGKAGARYEFVADTVTLGRRPGNDVPFDPMQDTKASGMHAEIRRSDAGWVLVDLGSTNGTFLGDQKVEGEVPLTDGANVEFGQGGPVVSIRILGDGVDEAGAPSTVQDIQAPATEPPSAAPVAPASSGRTGIYRMMMQETVKQSSKKLKLMIAVLAVLLIGGAIAVAVYLLQQQEKTRSLEEKAEAAEEQLDEANEKLEEESEQRREETSKLSDKLKTTESKLAEAQKALAASQVTATNKLHDLRQKIEKAEGDAKKKLEAQAQELEKTKAQHQAELARLAKRGTASQEIAQRYKHSLFMLIGYLPDKQVGYCTAFALNRTGLLATNAHCVRVMKDMHERGFASYARMNQNPSKTYRAVRWKQHSRYRGHAFSADVALVQVDLRGATLPMAVELASREESFKLAAGQPIYTMGFPGRVMNEARPVADFRAAVISRLTTFGRTDGTESNNRMVWHSALTSKGTSGSPLFNAEGRVIAVNNGGLSARRVVTRDAMGNLKTTYAYDATGLNFGIRVDALHELIAGWR